MRNEPTCLKSKPSEPSDLSTQCIEEADNIFWLECETKAPDISTPDDESTRDTEKPAPIPSVPTPSTPIPSAPTPSTTNTEETKDFNAIRKQLNDRNAQYKNNFEGIKHARVKKTKCYMRANHFLQNPPNLEAFKQLSEQIIQEMPRTGKKKKAALCCIFENTLWFLLDHLVQQSPENILADAEKVLPELLAAMKKKGADMNELGAHWNAPEMIELLGPAASEAIHQYLAIMKRP